VKWVAGLAVVFVVWVVVMTMAIAASIGGASAPGAPTAVNGIPPDYLALYVQAAARYKIDWAILAAIGFVETDHGRSTAQGVHSGRNTNGCCAGPMQFSFGTWETYGNGGDIYDPRDAIPAAARYLVASGAPGDYHRAIFAYNHAEWYYADVVSKAEEYRALATTPAPSGKGQSGPLSGPWLVPIPGTDQTCDARIVANVIMILQRFHAGLNACYAASGHEPNGEHPLGLAVDLVPRPPSSWGAMEDLARWAGWKPSCASSGCASQTGTAFRFVGWNGYPGHGDPAHAGTNAHLHLSWDHGPGSPARWVKLAVG
jgi:hypothetical protein